MNPTLQVWPIPPNKREQPLSDSPHSIRMQFTAWFYIFPLLWTLLIALSLWWNTSHIHRTIRELALVSARAAFEKDLLYRQWATLHGGVYVPVSEKTPPNPYLAGIPERDITTPSGRPLTLMNPAYMTRQVHELGQDLHQPSGHITSLKPIRPENTPDQWERQALETFERGAAEVSSVESMEGWPSLRFMRPLKVTAGCLKCHASQGYKEGDIRGGISVAVFLKDYEDLAQPHQREELLAHGTLWALGLLSFGLGTRQIQKRRRERDQAQVALRKSETRFRSIFEDSPIAIWEEDFSQVKVRLDELRRSGVNDFRDYLDKNPQEIANLVSQVRVVEINQASVQVFGAGSKEQIIQELPRYFTAGSLEVFKEEVITLAEGRTRFQCETPLIDVAGRPVVFDLTLAVQQGHEDTLSCVLVSFVDITERKRAGEELQRQADALQTSNEELTRFNRVATGRELRMIELKQKINELCRQSGQPPRYPQEFSESKTR